MAISCLLIILSTLVATQAYNEVPVKNTSKSSQTKLEAEAHIRCCLYDQLKGKMQNKEI